MDLQGFQNGTAQKVQQQLSQEVLSVQTVIRFVFREKMVMSVPLFLFLTRRLQEPCGMATSIGIYYMTARQILASYCLEI